MESRSPRELFDAEKPLIGVAHLLPLPDAPETGSDPAAVREGLIRDLEALTGVDGVLVENFGDAPYHPDRVPSSTVAFMSVLARTAVEAVDVPVGVNVLRNDARAALSAAEAAGADFVRVNVLTGARVTDQGIVEGRAHELLRLRRRLGSDVRIFADVDVKHSAPVSPRPLAEEVRETVERGRADAVLVTGSSTGRPPAADDLATARGAADVPVFAASGVRPGTLGDVLPAADGVIVGTALKEGGDVRAPVDPERVGACVREARAALDAATSGARP